MEKSSRNFLIGAGIIYALILIEIYFGVFGTYLHLYEKRAPTIANILALIPFAASGYILFKGVKQGDLGKSPGAAGAAILILLALGIALSAGFNFDLHGIEN
jgi:hypothetical protein